MAANKRSTRRRSSSARRRSGGSKASLLVLAAIVSFGAFSIWSTANHKSPQQAFATLFQRQLARITTPANTEKRPASGPAAASQNKPKPQVAPQTVVAAPVPRPSAPVGSSPEPRTIAELLSQSAKPQVKPGSSQTRMSAHPAPRSSTQGAMPPRGVNSPAHSPTVVFAKEKLIIRKTAWEKAPAIAVIEKGREMRSYGKTGRWHRVIVPTTNLIGWVHEDLLVGDKNKPDSASLMTGAIGKKTETGTPRMSTRPLPPKAIGH